MGIIRINYTLPTWAIPALINGDTSGLTDLECQALTDLECQAEEAKDANGASHYHWATDGGEPYPEFSHRNDLPSTLGYMGSDCDQIDLVLMGVSDDD